MKLIVLVAASALALAACSTPFKGDVVTLDTAAYGGNINASTGVTLGGVQASGHFVPVISSDGKTAITVPGPCGTAQSIATYGILSGNASAAITTAGGGAAAVAGPSQSVAVAANRMSSTGEAAVLLAAGGGAAPAAATVAAHEDCSKAFPQAAGAPAPAAQ